MLKRKSRELILIRIKPTKLKQTFIQLDILRVLSKNGALQLQVISEEDPRSLYIVSPSIQIYQ